MTKIESLNDFHKHPFFPLGIAGISQTILFMVFWGFWGAASIKSSSPATLGWLLFGSVISGGLGFICGASLMSGGRVTASQMMSGALIMESLALVSSALVSKENMQLVSAFFGASTGLFYAARNFLEINVFTKELRSGWLAAINFVNQISLLVTPFIIAWLSHLYGDRTINSASPACLFFGSLQLFLIPFVWKLKDTSIKENMTFSSPFKACFFMFKNEKKTFFFFILEAMHWSGKLLLLPIFIGLYFSGTTHQGMVEGFSSITAVLIGGMLLRKWTHFGRAKIMLFSALPLLLCWSLFAINPGATFLTMVILAKTLFQPTVDTSIRGAILDMVATQSSSYGLLSELCSRELLLMLGRCFGIVIYVTIFTFFEQGIATTLTSSLLILFAIFSVLYVYIFSKH